ncbi:MAG: nucleotidyltransferase family protein [Myxococcaceae bacterium]|nr:nucleotidyltransferase family protein [Myxococcaceae bacterium]
MALGAQYSRSSPLFEVLSRIPHRNGELRDLLPHLDSLRLVDAAARHGVSAWLADALGPLDFPGRDRLLADARGTVASAHKLKRLTLTVLDALHGAGVVPIALKGSVLAHRLYPSNPLCRPSSDVDVLVLPEELERVAAALQPLGLHRWVDPSLGDVFDDHHHLSFSGPPGLVEVHFRLISTFGRGLFDDDAIRARARDTTFERRRVRLLAPEDEFLYLATHAANHAFLRLAWLVDLQQFLRLHPALDWPAMAARAEDAGFTQALTVTLHLLARLLDVPVPDAAWAAFPGRRVRGLVDERLFTAAALVSASLATHRVGSFAARLWLVDTPRHAARHLLDGVKRYARRALARP